jgi:transposase
MGFLNPNKNDLESYMSTSTVNSDFVIACFDDFIEQLGGKSTIVILDNAPTHTSNKFQDKIEEWEKRGLSVYFIPPYSPNLNKIETLWRFMKYYWFELATYLSFENLWAYIEKVLGMYGVSEEYVINFG